MKKVMKNIIDMKFFRIIGILLILLVIDLTMEGCWKYKCPKIKSFEYFISAFSINKIDSHTLSWIENNLQQADNTIELRKDFGFDIVFKTEYTEIANCKPVHSLFIQSAYADFVCEGDMYYSKDKIIFIHVFPDKDFGETHPAGTDIADFFKIYWYPAYLISFESRYETPFPDFDSPPVLRYRCVCTATAVEAGEYEFTFVIGLSDERIFEQSIKAIFK